MSWIYSMLLLTTVAIQSSKGQLQGGDCIKIPSIENFDLEKAMGSWYPQEMASEEERVKECVYYSLSSDKNKANAAVTVKRTWNKRKKTQLFTMKQVKDTSQFEIDWLGTRTSIWMVATDYKSWSIWYICYPKSNVKSLLDITTRESKRNEDVINKAKEAMTIDFSVLKENMKTIDRSKC